MNLVSMINIMFSFVLEEMSEWNDTVIRNDPISTFSMGLLKMMY